MLFVHNFVQVLSSYFSIAIVHDWKLRFAVHYITGLALVSLRIDGNDPNRLLSNSGCLILIYSK